MQSFEEPTGGQKVAGRLADEDQPAAPAASPDPQAAAAEAERAHRRGDQPSGLAGPGAAAPGPLRPAAHLRHACQGLASAADRPLPGQALARRRARRRASTATRWRRSTSGWSPAKLENLLDEALVNAVRRGADEMNWKDVESARLTSEVGLGAPVAYTEHERRLIATHEAGHATMAWLVAPQRRLEVLTIVKRGEALGMLAHGDREDVFTRGRAELRGDDPDRVRRPGRRGAVLRRRLDRSRGRPRLRDPDRRADGRCRRHGGLVGVVRRRARQGFMGTDLVGKVLADGRMPRAGGSSCSTSRRPSPTSCSPANRHLVIALRDALLAARGARRLGDHRRARGRRARAAAGRSTCGTPPSRCSSVDFRAWQDSALGRPGSRG